MTEQVLYDARTDGSLLQFWWLFFPMTVLCLVACYATWWAKRKPTSFWGRRFSRLKVRGERGLWDYRHPFAFAAWAFLFFSVPMIYALVCRELISYRLAHRNYRSWYGVLASDTVVSLGSRRRTTLESDELWIGGLRFIISCWVPPGPFRALGSSGSCGGLILGRWMTAVYLPLPHSRYRITAVQIRSGH